MTDVVENYVVPELRRWVLWTNNYKDSFRFCFDQQLRIIVRFQLCKFDWLSISLPSHTVESNHFTYWGGHFYVKS